jgi:diaminopimelate decarboxylase
VDDALIAALARTYGTSLYIYDRQCLSDRCVRLMSALAPKVRLYYAVKANPLVELLRLFREYGCGAEVASAGELERALAAGFEPAAIAYTSPGKTRAGVGLAVRAGVGLITVESIDEAALVDAVAGANRLVRPVAVRINPRDAGAFASPRMAGVPSQFGVDDECFADFFEEFRRFEHLRIHGTQVYTGTQILAAGALLSDALVALEVSGELARRHQFDLEVVDIGGGFGVPYHEDERELDLDALRAGYASMLSGEDRLVDPERVIVESGRYLTAPAGVFVTRVLATKQSRGVKYVICDGGYAQHSASLHIARFGRNRHRIDVLGTGGPAEVVTVVGPTGTPVDLLAREVRLPRISAGDLLVVRQSGAYGYTNACQLFFSDASPAELLIDGDQVEILRARGSFSDLAFDKARRGRSP